MEWLLIIAVILWMGWTAFMIWSLAGWAEKMSDRLGDIQNNLERPKDISESAPKITQSLEEVSSYLDVIAQKLSIMIEQRDCENYSNAMTREKSWTYQQSMSSWQELRTKEEERVLAERCYSNFRQGAVIVTESQRASISLLQRRLKISYHRAEWIIEELEKLGIVGPANGTKPREILVTDDREIEEHLQKLGQEEVYKSALAFRAKLGENAIF